MKKLILAAALAVTFSLASGLAHAGKDTEIKVKGHSESCCKKSDSAKAAKADDCCKKAGTAQAEDCCKKGHDAHKSLKKDAKAGASNTEKPAHGTSACCKKAGTADASECCKKHDAGIEQACCKKGTEKKS